MRIVVPEWQRVLRYRKGQFVELLSPGAYWRHPLSRLVRVDARPRLLTLPAQEILTLDRVSLKASAVLRWLVTDPRRWYEAVQDPEAFAYLAAQVALRDVVGGRTLDAVLSERAQLGEEMTAAAAPALADLGATVQTFGVRDLMLPGELRRAATEAAAARTQGLAALERARAEVAATRALTNAARLVSDHPALLQLRTLQAVESGRATVVLSTVSGVAGATGTSGTGAPPAPSQSDTR